MDSLTILPASRDKFSSNFPVSNRRKLEPKSVWSVEAG